MAILGPGSPGYVQSQQDAASQAAQGDVQRAAGTLANAVHHITSNNSFATFITNNVACAASVQTVIASITLPTGEWNIDATVCASINTVLALGAQEVALIPHGSAASVGYASAPLALSAHQTEGGAALNVTVVVTGVSQVVDLVGSSAATSPFTALASSLNGYANATGISAVPTV